jgi:hypothetical protein
MGWITGKLCHIEYQTGALLAQFQSKQVFH